MTQPPATPEEMALAISPSDISAARPEDQRDVLPPEVLAQLSYVPEERPADFSCAICLSPISNKFNWSPKHYERAPVCKCCEEVSGYSWNGSAKKRTAPIAGAYRDRRNALRISALADAIAQEANHQRWSKPHAAT